MWGGGLSFQLAHRQRGPACGEVCLALQDSIGRQNLSRSMCFDGGQSKITTDKQNNDFWQ